MKHTLKTTLSLMLILAVVMSLLPVRTLAADPDADSRPVFTAFQEIVTDPIYTAVHYQNI
jgi:hypothetical protein